MVVASAAMPVELFSSLLNCSKTFKIFMNNIPNTCARFKYNFFCVSGCVPRQILFTQFYRHSWPCMDEI
jgi:hypothetical protein